MDDRDGVKHALGFTARAPTERRLATTASRSNRTPRQRSTRSATSAQGCILRSTVTSSTRHDFRVSYYPDGSGPIIEGRGRLRFTYHDSVGVLSFYGDEVRTVDVPDLDTVASVTIVQTFDTGSTSASLLVPHVVLPSTLPVAINTELITTRHLFFATALGHPQRDVYSVRALTGVASAGILPLQWAAQR